MIIDSVVTPIFTDRLSAWLDCRTRSGRWLGPAGLSVADSGAFRAIVDLTEKSIRVRGRMRPLLPGMGGQADIVVGRRSLASYAFEPLRALPDAQPIRQRFAERAARVVAAYEAPEP